MGNVFRSHECLLLGAAALCTEESREISGEVSNDRIVYAVIPCSKVVPDLSKMKEAY